ncbi:transcription factor 20 [Scleropages formosus]|uniref:transcription factor 20 n=1 Tax=Scleropages formosus TaxID=113540 RepID=UPI0010FA7F37|nr:transcription factor 20 [Scleropages formosus]
MSEEHAEAQRRAQQNSQTQNQFPHHTMSHHPGQTSLLQGYGSRIRGGAGGKGLQSNANSSSSHLSDNPYQKEVMEYYMATGGKDRQRRGSQGLAYGSGFGYPNVDGQVPPQYRHPGNGPGSSGMSQYQLDYSARSGSGGSSSSSNCGTGTFSPSHQYCLSQNSSIHSTPGHQTQPRQQGQNYPSGQALPQRQQQRGYPLSGHKHPAQFSQYPSAGTTPGSTGVYNLSQQRYHGNAGSYESEVTNSVSANKKANSNHTSVKSNNIPQLDSIRKGYLSSNYPLYDFHGSQSLSKHSVYPHRYSQHNLKPDYDASMKIHSSSLHQTPAIPYPKHLNTYTGSSNSHSSSIPQFSSQEISKSLVQSQTQQPQVHQNFSPVSNPSPAASGLQSPSCSSSPSPLMGVSEGSRNSVTPSQVTSQTPLPNSRNTHTRLLRATPQLSPTPSSNSSISSCGSSVVNVNTTNVKATAGDAHIGSTQSQMGKGGISEENLSCPYPLSVDKLTREPEINSLNALTSQVANLPNIVQDMQVSQNRGKDNDSQQKGRGGGNDCTNAAKDGRRDSGDTSDSVVVESPIEIKQEGEEQLLAGEGGRTRQISGVNESSNVTSHTSSKNQVKQGKNGCHDLSDVETGTLKKHNQTLSCLRGREHHLHDGSSKFPSSQSSLPSSVECSQNLPPSCKSAPCMSTSISQSPKVMSSFHSNFAVGLNQKTNVTHMEKNERNEDHSEKDPDGKTSEKSEDWKCNLPRSESEKSETCNKQRDKELVNHSQPSSLKSGDDDGENVKMLKVISTGESQNTGGVGVIVSPHSETPQSETSVELFRDNPSIPQHLMDQHQNPDKACSLSVSKDSRCLNGESEGSLSMKPSINGTNFPFKSGCGPCILPQYRSGNQKSLHAYSELHDGNEMDLQKRGSLGFNPGKETNLKYHGQHHPPLNYIPGQRKELDPIGTVRPNRRGSGRRQDINPQLQQPPPSLLKEFLQGYNLNKSYDHAKNSVQVSNIKPESQNISPNLSLSRHSYGVAGSTVSHSQTHQTVIDGDHHASIQRAVPGNDYPLNLKQGSKIVDEQDPPLHSWGTNDIEAERTHCDSSEKSEEVISPNHSALNLQQTSESSQLLPSKHINLADYSLPHRKTSNLLTPASAVQQLLLQVTEPLVNNNLSVNQNRPQKSSSLPSSVLSSERRSVICDVSFQTTSEKQKKNKEQEKSKQAAMPGSSVIQQSLSASLAILDGNIKEEEGEVKMDTECHASKKSLDETDNTAFYTRHIPAKKSPIQQQNRSPFLPIEKLSDPPNLPTGENRNVSLASVNPYHSHQTPHLQSSSSARCHSNFPAVDGPSCHSGYGLENVGQGSSFHPQISSQQHLPSKFQLENSEFTNKLQRFSQLHPLQYSNSEEKLECATSNKNRYSMEIVMGVSAGVVGRQYQSPPGIGSQTLHFAPDVQQQFPQQGSYDVSQYGREGRRTLDSDTYHTNKTGAIIPPSDPSSGVTEKVVKLFQTIPISGAHSQSSKDVHLMTQQGHKQKTERSAGEPNPLMMRRRVRSFISPIPAKRQHQDLSQQQQQRNTTSRYQSPLQNSAHRHHDTDTSSPEVSYSKLALPETGCPSLTQNLSSAPTSPQGKTKILPARKGRGLKLEAIVQKITPNVKKTINNNRSYTNSAPGTLSDLTVGDPIHYNAGSQESGDGENLPKLITGHGNSSSYADEGLSLEEIMSYKGVEETGPLAPTAYPCEPQQNQPILHHGNSGNFSRCTGESLKGLDFGAEALDSQFTERECEGGRCKDGQRMHPDFSLLGPLPPPPPLPCPVQGSPPPSSSVLSDFQHFTSTYQQLETRRGEDTTANFLRRKLNETGMTLGVDDYVDTDFFGSSSFHHSQNSGLCLLTRPPNSQQLHQQHHFAQTVSSMKSPSQLSEARPLENVVPKGYFPSGKKKGRPVGSVNKQKRSQSQTQNTSISAPPVLSTSVQMTTPTPAHTVSPEVVPVTTTPIPVTHPADSEGPYEVSSTDCQVKIDTEKENATATVELEPTRPIQQNKNDESQGNGIEDKQRKRKRRVAALMGKEVLQSSTGAEFLSVTEIFADHKTFVFAPYIHVERKVKEIGAVCTIVNEELDRIKWESGGEKGKEGGRSDIVLDSTLSSDLTRGKRDTEILNKEPKVEQDPMSLQSCTAGKTIPLSGYVLSGPLMTESSNVGHLLCCLCKKWANYKNLGDLFGPYYSPEYVATLPKNQPQIRHTLGTTKVCNKGVLLETPVLESNKKEIQQTESQTAKSAVDCTEKEVTHLVSHAAATAPVDEWEMPDVLENICNVYTDREVAQKNDLINEPITPLKQHEQMQTEESLQNGPQQTEDIQYRPQHRKLTSHPRFKRRHRSSEDLLKTGPSNFKALLPFQPPPQLPNQDPSEPFVHLSQLPEIPLDPEELWVHEGCIAWASGVFLVNGRLYGLQEALDGARDTSCSYCGLVGSTLGCYSKGCSLSYHYLCAIEADCSLNEDNFSMRCPKHKIPQKSGPEKALHPEQSERGSQNH